MSYIWDQNYEFVTIIVGLEKNTSSRDISCEVSSQKIKLQISGVTICDDQLEEKVYPDLTVWYISTTMDGTKELYVELAKAENNNGWWKRLLLSDANDPKRLSRYEQSLDEFCDDGFKDAAARIHEMRKDDKLPFGKYK